MPAARTSCFAFMLSHIIILVNPPVAWCTPQAHRWSPGGCSKEKRNGWTWKTFFQTRCREQPRSYTGKRRNWGNAKAEILPCASAMRANVFSQASRKRSNALPQTPLSSEGRVTVPVQISARALQTHPRKTSVQDSWERKE